MNQQTAVPSLNFSDLMADRTRDFTGRSWVFAEIDEWLAHPAGSRYFLIMGSPGSGKTALIARLVQTRTVAASYFCIARQENTLDPLNMARSLSQQLSRIDGFALAILKESNIQIEITINIQENYGPVIGTQIENLFASSTPSQAFNRTVIEPLHQLYHNGYERQIVIVVDALDETASSQGRESIVRLLSGVKGLPPQVRFVLTSRPESSILGQFEQLPITSLLLDAEGDENTRDIEAYVRRRLVVGGAHNNPLQQRLAEESLSLETFIDHVVAASKGNFLYLTYLLPAIANKMQQISSLAAFPQGLDGIYRDFFLVRIDSGDKTSWRKLYRLVLGILAIARIALTEEQIIRFTGLDKEDVTDVLLDIQQFLDPVSKARKLYQFYHQSIADFLGNEAWSSEVFSIDQETFHKRIVSYYRGRVLMWQDVKWDKIDDYGLLYLASHLYALRHIEVYQQELYALLCQPFMHENYIHFGSHRSFANVVELAIDLASEEEPPNLVQGVRASLLYAILSLLSTNVPLEALFVLAQTDQVAKAEGFAAVMIDPMSQYAAYQLIAEALFLQGKQEEALSLLKGKFNSDWDKYPYMAPTLAKAGLVEQALYLADLIRHPDEVLAASGVGPMILSKSSKKRLTYEKLATIGEAMMARSRSGQVEQVLELADLIEDEYQRMIALSDAAETLAQIGQFHQALTVARIIQGEYRRGVTLCSIARRMVEAGQTEQAKVVANEAMTTVENILVTARGIFGEGDKAIALCEVAKLLVQVEGSERIGAVVDRVLTEAESIALTARCASSEDDEDMVVAQTPQIKKNEAIPPNKITQPTQEEFLPGSSIDAELDLEVAKLLSVDEEDQAWFEAIGEHNKRQHIFTTFTRHRLAQVNADLDDAMSLYIALQENYPIEREEYNKAYLLEKVVQAWACVGKIDRAVDVADNIRRGENKVSALNKVAQTLLQAGEIGRARTIAFQALEVARSLNSATSLTEVAHILSQIGETKHAETTVTEALMKSETFADTEKANTLSRMAQILSWGGPIDQVLAAADKISPDLKASLLSDIARSLLQAGQKERARTIANRACMAGQMFVPGRSYVRYDVQKLKRQGMSGNDRTLSRQSMLRGLEMMRLEDSTTDIQSKMFTSWFERAQETWEHSRNKILSNSTGSGWKNKIEALMAVAQALAGEEQIDWALEVALRLNAPNGKALALCKIAQTLVQMECKDRAEDVAKQSQAAAFEAMGNYTSLVDPVILLGEIAQVFAQIGDRERARDTAMRLLELARTNQKSNEDWAEFQLDVSKQENVQAGMIRKVAYALAQIGYEEEARQLEQVLRNQGDTVPELNESEETGGQKLSFQALLAEFTRARLEGRDAVFSTLKRQASNLGTIDQGQTLWQIYEAVQQIEQWFTIPQNTNQGKGKSII